MGLSTDLISQFAKLTKEEKTTKQETVVYGKAIVDNEGQTFVQIDGSDLWTPVDTSTAIKSTDKENSERVTVLVKDHSATIIGNTSSPSARDEDVSGIVYDISDKVSTKELEAERARISDLETEDALIRGRLTAGEAEIDELQADNVTIKNQLSVANADIKNLKTDKLDASTADVTYAKITDLEATNAKFNNLGATYASIEDLNAVSADIDELDSIYAKIVDLNATNANVDNLKSDVADIDTLMFGSAGGNTIQTSFANAVIAQLGDAQIKSAMIESVAASKITAGDIVTNDVRVVSDDGRLVISDETIQISDDTRVRVQIGKDDSGDYSINVWDANGNLMFSEGGITDSAIKDAIIRNDMVSDTANIAAHKLDIDSLFEEINGSSKTIKSARIYLDEQNQSLDVAFKEVTTDISDLQSNISSQGTELTAVQGQISSKVWQQDIDTATDELNAKTDTLSTKYTTLEQEVEDISATIAEHASTISTTADSETVTEISDKVASLEIDLSGFRSTVSSTYATKTEVNSIEIGGRNLFSGYTDEEIQLNDYQSTGSFTQFRNCLTFDPSTTVGSTYTIGFWAKSPNGETTLSLYNTNGKPRYFYFSKQLTAGLGTEWEYFTYTFTNTDMGEDYTGTDYNRIEIYAKDQLGVLVKKIKVEKGNKATDWTPAPEDMATSDDISSVQSSAELIEERVSTSETLIEQLSDSIATLVTDSNGESLMTQVSGGWTFSTTDIQNLVDETSEKLNNLVDEIGDVDSTVSALQQAVDDLGILNEYVKIGTYESEPCIELGELNSDFKLIITNTKIMFMEGSDVPAYINNQSLFIKKAVIEEELQQGEFLWKARSNGNLGLIWKEATS